MESYQDKQDEEGQQLILPVIIEAGSIVNIHDILRIIPRALINYLDAEYCEDGLFPEQDFLEWMSDGSIVDIRVASDISVTNENQKQIECLGHRVIIEQVVMAGEIPDYISKLKRYFPQNPDVNSPYMETGQTRESFNVPLVSIVACRTDLNGDAELLNQVCFTASSIFFTLQEKEVDEWRSNDFRLEVFLEEDIIANSNTRVLTTVEETGKISSTGFWID